MMAQQAKTAMQSEGGSLLDALLVGIDPDCWLTLWRKRNAAPVTEWQRVSDREALIRQAEANSRAGWDCYFSVCPGLPKTPDAEKKNRRIKAADVAFIPAYFMDIDVLTQDKQDHEKKGLPESVEDAQKGLLALPVPPSALVLSGRGIHAYWLLDKPLDASQNAARALKAFAEAVAFFTGWLSLDAHASEPARVLRVPGTKNHKDPYNPLDVRLLHLDDSQRYASDVLDVWANQQVEVDPVFEAVELAPRPTGRNWQDDEIIQLASKQRKSGPDFSTLFAKGTGGDHSAADYQLCRLLAYWTQDPDQIDRIFRKSALMRDKWDREDYRLNTIAKAQIAAEKGRRKWQQGNATEPSEGEEDSEKGKGKPPLTYDVFLNVLAAQNIQIRLNTMSNEIEFSGLPRTFSAENALNTAPPFIRQEFLAPVYKGADRQTVSEMITRCADINRYNPVIDWLNGLQWSGADAVDWLQSDVLHLGKEDELSRALVKKWLIQCVAMAYNGTNGHFYGADGVLTLQGAQGTGKTTFFQRLVPDPNWFRAGVQIDMNVKDTQLNALSTWIAELGEVDSTLKKEQSQLKAFITNNRDNIRAPYAPAAVNRPRRTSFGATVNEDQFLRDTTGARRWWTVPVLTPISWQLLDGIALEQLWAQVYALWRKTPQGFRLTGEEQGLIAQRNGQFETMMPGEDEVRQALVFDAPVRRWREITASDLRDKLMCQATAEQIGRVISKLSKEDNRIRLRRTESGRCRLWLLPPVG